jgi:hypothetical protein
MAAYESRVDVFSIDPIVHLASFDTILDFGGHRLALADSSAGPAVVAGAWERFGVRAYDRTTGHELWQRPDLKRVNLLAPAADGTNVAVAMSGAAMRVLDMGTGETVGTIRGVETFHQSRFDAVAVVGWYAQVSLIETVDWRRRWRAPVRGFSLLGAVFAPDAVLVSDTGDGASVSCFDLSGRLMWRRRNETERLIWAVGWDETTDSWLGLEHHVELRVPDQLVRWSRDGAMAARRPVGFVIDAAFLPGGRWLATARGEIIDTESGRVNELPATG